jgi:hypothetical protein
MWRRASGHSSTCTIARPTASSETRLLSNGVVSHQTIVSKPPVLDPFGRDPTATHGRAVYTRSYRINWKPEAGERPGGGSLSKREETRPGNPAEICHFGGVEYSLEWVVQGGIFKDPHAGPSQPSPFTILYNVDSTFPFTLNQRVKMDRSNGGSAPTLGLSDRVSTRFYEPRAAASQAGDHRTSSGDLTSARR